MKTIILSGILFVLSITVLHAQETDIPAKKSTESPVETPNFFIGLGLSTQDNGESISPFNTENFAFKTPFFLTLERSLKTNFSLALSFSTNSLQIKSDDKFYFGIDISGRYYFDDYIFKNKNIETYAGLGLGRFYLENNGNNTFNVSLGGRYWFSKSFAVSLQGIGKVALQPVNNDVLNYYEYNLGIVWRNKPIKMKYN